MDNLKNNLGNKYFFDFLPYTNFFKLFVLILNFKIEFSQNFSKSLPYLHIVFDNTNPWM